MLSPANENHSFTLTSTKFPVAKPIIHSSSFKEMVLMIAAVPFSGYTSKLFILAPFNFHLAASNLPIIRKEHALSSLETNAKSLKNRAPFLCWWNPFLRLHTQLKISNVQ